ncbi:MAG: hypothetical protein ACK5NY_09755 [Burkholderiaceae bacterium]
MTTQNRKRLFGWSACLFLVATVLIVDRSGHREQPPPGRSAVLSVDSSVPAVREQVPPRPEPLLHRESIGLPTKTVDLFRPHAWFVAPPPPPPAAPERVAPPKPAAPPLPYRLVGRFKNSAGEDKWYVIQGNQLEAVETGKILNATYKVEAIGQREIVLTYLPLHERQIIALPVGEP